MSGAGAAFIIMHIRNIYGMYGNVCGFRLFYGMAGMFGVTVAWSVSDWISHGICHNRGLIMRDISVFSRILSRQIQSENGLQEICALMLHRS